jgi:LAS superfamily LD-carboxypeptidase LdcB
MLGITIITAILIVLLGWGWQFLGKPVAQKEVVSSPVLPSPAYTPLVIPQEPVNTSTSLLPPRRKTIVPPAPGIQNPAPIPPEPALPSLPSLPPAYPTALGHFPYAEAEPDSLVAVGMYYDRPEFLVKEAALAWQKMQAQAQAQGVKMRIISGFRSVAAQEALFTRQTKLKGSVQEAARFSAPPGYSEHHTGYTLDIGDGRQLATDLKYQFAQTATYRWLGNHAADYGFELSFPPNNAQGIAFEPWHWRYVGSDRARYIFAAARGS